MFPCTEKNGTNTKKGTTVPKTGKGWFPKGWFLADVFLYQNFHQKVFPCSATLAEESYDFCYSWTHKTGTKVHSPKSSFYKTALICFHSNLFDMS